MVNCWVISVGHKDKSRYWKELFTDKEVIAVGFAPIDISGLTEKEVEEEVNKWYKQNRPKENALGAKNTLIKFRDEIAKGDIVIAKEGMTDYDNRKNKEKGFSQLYGVGIVKTGKYEYVHDLEDLHYYHRKDVEWIITFPNSPQKLYLQNNMPQGTLRNYKYFTQFKKDILKKFPKYTTKFDELEKYSSINTEKPKEQNKSKYSNSRGSPKNLILYGPPGTGKTFITKQKAIDIIENKSNILNINEEFPPLSIEEAKKVIEYLKNRKKEETLEFLKMLIKGRVYRDEVIKKFNCSGNHVDLGILGNYTSSINKVRNITAPESRIYDWDDKNKFWTLDETTKDNLKKALKEVEDGSS